MRYLTEDLPGTGGEVRWEPEDFEVDEIPLYEPSGVGAHTYLVVEKRGLTTFRAAEMIAQALGVDPRQVGYAGMKDAHALTRQTFSIEGVAPEQALGLAWPGLRVLAAARHRNKLKLGHLRGNRFRIRVRGVEQPALPRCRAILDVLQKRGLPNAFGEQRFGMRADSHCFGRSVVKGDIPGAVRQFLGRPHPAESQEAQEARRLFDAGEWQDSLRWLPGGMRDERSALERLIRSGGSYHEAFQTIPKRLKRFFISAYQSYLFNSILEQRLTTLDQLYAGDLAMKHENGAVFLVEDANLEQPRAERLEISPSGPLFGYKVRLAEGTPGEVERQALAAEGMSVGDFRIGDGLAPKGERRALRVPLGKVDAGWDDGIVLRFSLPAGSYATVLLAEVMKCPLS